MFGRMIKVAALAGVGTMAYRWWQNKQAEDREYAGSDFRSPSSGMGASTGGASSTGGVGSAAGGSTSPIGTRADQVPAQ